MLTKPKLKQEKGAVMTRYWAVFAFTIFLAGCAGAGKVAHGSALGEPTPNTARNVIVFLGDGMGVSTVTAARIFDGQSRGESGEENVLPFERFKHVGLVKTYNSNQQVPDSAGTATALFSGVRTKAGVIGIGPGARRGDCTSARDNEIETLGEVAASRGLAVGVVTTARLTHATPAAFYAHSADRNWEGDADLPLEEQKAGCRSIASQLLDFPFVVALGGGSAKLGGGKSMTGTEPEERILEWAQSTGGQVVRTREALSQSAGDRPILGLFAPSHMSFELDRTPDSREPTLPEMTAAAIRHLSGRHGGYVLLVEGGRIDHGHHEGRAAYALRETQEFARAVQLATELTNSKETLILVTADHSHVLTMAGYPTKGNPILGLVHGNDEHGEPRLQPTLADDGKPYTTLGYINGPGSIAKGDRPAPDVDPLAVQQALIPTSNTFPGGGTLSETHAGEDVAVYARGPGADRVRGVMDQYRIFEIIVRALGWHDLASIAEGLE